MAESLKERFSAIDLGPGTRELRTLLQAIIDDIDSLAADLVLAQADLVLAQADLVLAQTDIDAINTGNAIVTAQLDADAGVTDTDYAANADVASLGTATLGTATLGTATLGSATRNSSD